MTVAVYVPVALSLVLALASRVVAPRWSPARTALAVVVAGVLCSTATVWGLVLLAATLVGDTAIATREAAERDAALPEPVPELIGWVAVAALACGLMRTVAAARRRRSTTRELRAVCAAADPGADLVVVALPAAHAFAVPGRPARVIVTRGLLTLLDAAERRSMLAHERAHLQGRHHWLRAAMECAAALNPLLIPARVAVAYLVERAADETAAAVTGDRPVAARALTKAALADREPPGARRSPMLAFHDTGVAARVAALHDAPPPASWWPGGLVGVALIAAAAALEATAAFLQLFSALLG